MTAPTPTPAKKMPAHATKRAGEAKNVPREWEARLPVVRRQFGSAAEPPNIETRISAAACQAALII